MNVYTLVNLYGGLVTQVRLFATEEARQAAIEKLGVVPDSEGSGRYINPREMEFKTGDSRWTDDEWYTDVAHVEGLEGDSNA